MAYILQKGAYYCYLDGKHAICKTQNLNLATRFETQGNARAILNKATKKRVIPAFYYFNIPFRN